MQLCAANGGNGALTPERSPRLWATADWGTGGLAQTPERSPRFVPTPDWGAGRFAEKPERSPRFAVTPEWGARFMMPTPERGAETAKTPDRWSALPRTPEYASADVKASRKEIQSVENDRVSDFMDGNSASWNVQRLQEEFIPMEVEVIKSPSQWRKGDFWACFFDKKGTFSIHSAYNMPGSTETKLGY
ncbi:unnamed protein product [Triticum turgidum subsp. durum]|uniref:Uncharacterized protein n=1 Tax=Triticum turgidum subsp. durum TaxID=4567 RepID=A0A9R0Z965_TRITD|nr:unnamed protein product [Triticum turgidum subsp. durum]